MDEPAGNLDKQTGEEVLTLLSSCASRFGQTLIMVTHDPGIAAQANQALQIQDGRLL